MQSLSQDERIESMYRNDRAWALVALVVLWMTIVFVFFEIAPNTDAGVFLALAAGAGMVLVFNTASIIALLKHYADDKQHLYGLDVHYLDEMKRLKR